MMKTPLLLTAAALLVALSAPLQAITFTDDFQRENTTSGLGPNWDTASTIFLNGGNAKTQTGGSQNAIFNGFDIDTSFDLSALGYAQAPGRYFGLVFNYADTDNYYTFRASYTDGAELPVWQFIARIDGTNDVVEQGNLAESSMPINTWRSFNVATTENPNEYHLTITNNTGTETYLDTTVTSTSLAVGGKAGFNFGSSYMWADSFELTTVPEPSTTAALIGVVGLAGVLFLRRRSK